MHIQKERKLLFILSAVFLIIALVVFGYGMTIRAEETVDYSAYSYRLQADWLNDNSSNTNYCFDYEFDIVSTLPIIGYSGTGELNNITLLLADYENKTSYAITSSDGVSKWLMSYGRYGRSPKGDGSALTIYEISSSSYIGGYQNNLLTINLGDSGKLNKFTGKIFSSSDFAKNHIETGSLDGLLYDGSPTDEQTRDFGEDYDPDVPIPQLKNLSHNGFTVSNNSNMLELDLVVDSYFYGLKHKSGMTTTIGLEFDFEVDKSQLIAEHQYNNIINSEIGFTGSEVVLTNAPTFNCKNRLDLFNDGLNYFHNTYSSHKELPDYNWAIHSQVWYGTLWEKYQNLFSVNADYETALETTGQAFTKYYVRFRQLKSNGDGTYGEANGQWYCYTFNTNKNFIVSPVVGDENGDPIETDPIRGEQDPDTGDPTYGGSIIDVDVSNPVAMLQDFIDFLVGLPEQLGQISAFLKDAFGFIPDKYWTIIFAGVGFSIVFLIFRAIK